LTQRDEETPLNTLGGESMRISVAGVRVRIRLMGEPFLHPLGFKTVIHMSKTILDAMSMQGVCLRKLRNRRIPKEKANPNAV
jgi:hypothetical protein